MNTPQYDILIIGAGHNGLTAAAVLARQGKKVLVLERHPLPGGAAATEGALPACQVNTGAADAGLFSQKLAAELRLEDFGLRWLTPAALVTALAPEGQALTVWRDPERTAAEIGRFSAKDAAAYPAFARRIERLAAVLAAMAGLTPPALPALGFDDMKAWAGPALQARRLGGAELTAFMRLLPMSAADWLGETFETPLLQAALGAGGVQGSLNGPYGSGSGFLMLYHAMNAGPGAPRAVRFVQGGTGALSQALLRSAESAGAKVRLSSPVKRLLLEDGRVTGAELESGERLTARAVLSSAPPRSTFFDLLGAAELPVSFVREIKNLRLRASTARVTLLVEGLPRFAGLPDAAGERLSGHLLAAPSLMAIEQAYTDAKYGALSARPLLDILVPTVLDPALAPPGMHLLSINVQYAPYSAADPEAQRQAILSRTLATLAPYAPGLAAQVRDSHVLSPYDLEQEYGLDGGDLYHGQMGLDQLLFLRPAPAAARYATPVAGLYLCGAGTHPGGGLTGMPGVNAAREVLKELGG